MRVIVGGTSFLSAPLAIREFLGADVVMVGPGEKALPFILESNKIEGIISGYNLGIEPDLVHPRAELIDYAPYLESGNPVGIEFRKGCPFGCDYCIERLRPVLARRVEVVVEELKALAGKGYRYFFFSDSELNLDVDGTKRLLSSVAREVPGIRWTTYLRPSPMMDRELVRLISISGGDMVTISLESATLYPRTRGEESALTGEVRDFLHWAHQEGIKVAVDLLVGFPGEEEDSVLRTLSFLQEVPVSSVGVSSYFRLYEGTPLAERVLEREGLPPEVLGNFEDNPGLLQPVFYNWLRSDRLRQLLPAGHFHLAGEDRKVNYQRVD